MSNQWYYNCDGRTGGPVSQVQLQLMVNSGTLLAHHQVRRGDMPNWLPARSIRGLFSSSPVSAEGIPHAAPVAVAAPVAEPESAAEPPFGFLGQSAPADDPPSAEVFNFFADPGPTVASPPAKPAAKPPQLNRKAPEPAKVVALAENDEPVALPDDATPLPPVAPPKPVTEVRDAEPMKSPQPKAPELATPAAAAALL